MSRQPAVTHHVAAIGSWTTCNLGPLRRARRSPDPDKTTCPSCLASRRLDACLYGYDGVPIGEPEDIPGQLDGHEHGCTGP